MSKIFPDKPEFLCARCKDVLCDDCASIAAEYEFLCVMRSQELARVQDEIALLNAEIVRQKRDAEFWEELGKIGMPTLMRAWLDHEIEKARKAGRESMRRELKESRFLEKMRRLEAKHDNR